MLEKTQKVEMTVRKQSTGLRRRQIDKHKSKINKIAGAQISGGKVLGPRGRAAIGKKPISRGGWQIALPAGRKGGHYPGGCKGLGAESLTPSSFLSRHLWGRLMTWYLLLGSLAADGQ